MPDPKDYFDQFETDYFDQFESDSIPEEESTWTKLNKPIIDAPSRLARQFSTWITDQNLAKYIPKEIDPGGMTRGFIGGSAEGLGDILSSLTSPLVVASLATGTGEVAAASKGLKGITKVLGAARIGTSLPFAVHGGQEVIRPDATLAERGMGLAEAAGGLTGTVLPIAKVKGITPKISGASRIIPKEEIKVEQAPFGISEKYKESRERLRNEVELWEKGTPINLNNEIQIPEITKIPEEPQSAKTKTGIKIGADVESLGRLLGSSLYQGEISKIATKELTQNALDAVRDLGINGKVDIKFDRGSNPYVQVTDNGKGLSRTELETVFTDLGS